MCSLFLFQVKLKAVDEVFETAHVIDKILEEKAYFREPEASRPGYHNLLRICNQARQKMRPDEPRDLNFDVSYLYTCNVTPEKVQYQLIICGTE